MADGGNTVQGKATIPVKEMALANLDKIFPHCTPEQITALKEGKPVPPSRDWEGFSPANTKAVVRTQQDPTDSIRIQELNQKLDEMQLVLREKVRREGMFDGFLEAMRGTGPTVTAILVFSDRNRLRRARKAVNQFVAQSYPNKQIVIVNASDLDITNVPHKQVLELKWNGDANPSVGAMRNFAIDNAEGDLLFPFWDDDDVYDRDLLAFLVACDNAKGGVMLRSQVRVDIKNSVAYSHVEPDGIPNTLLCQKTAARFEEKTGGEDFAFVQRYWALKSMVVDNSAWPLNTLLMRVHDGNNVRTAADFMVGHDQPDMYGKWELGANEAEHMKAVLATFGLKAEPKLPQEAPQPATA